MSLPPLLTRSFRLTGLAALFLLVAVLTPPQSESPTGWPVAGATAQPWAGDAGSAVRVAPALGEEDATARPAAARPAAALWEWPLAPPHVVLRPFIAPATRYSPGHRGIDVAAPIGTDVLSPASGVVHYSGVVVDRPVISIRHGDGLISSFEPVESELTEGSVVDAGSVIGTVMAGHCTAPCVHFGVRRHGEYVSPLNYLGGIPPSVLLPTRSL